jgi:hypothetical protein
MELFFSILSNGISLNSDQELLEITDFAVIRVESAHQRLLIYSDRRYLRQIFLFGEAFRRIIVQIPL